MSALQKQWSALQARNPLPLSQLSTLDIERDAFVTLPELDQFLQSIKARQTDQDWTNFQSTSSLVRLSPRILPHFTMMSSSSGYTKQNLRAFELWVESYIENWNAANVSDRDTCEKLDSLIRSYHGLASQEYAGNPEAISIMHSTLLQLWKASDMSAVRLCPLLANYKPCLSLDFAQTLLLPSRIQMEHLHHVEEYIAARASAGRLASVHIFYEMNSDCFAARYFDQTPTLQMLLVTILSEADKDKNEKISELHRQKAA